MRKPLQPEHSINQRHETRLLLSRGVQLNLPAHSAQRTEAIMSDRGFWFLIVVGACLVFWASVITTAALI